MPTWIVTHSEFLCNFFVPLVASFSPAQLRHALNFLEALLVCSAKHKTLAALTRLLQVDHADQFALVDFFRVSPWSGEAVRQAVTLFILKVVAELQDKSGWRLLFLSIDDSLARKDVATHKLQAVSLHFDHVRQRRQKGNCTNGSKNIGLHLQLGPAQFLLTWRPYYKRSQVKQLNRTRRAQGLPPLAYHSLPDLAQEMLDEVAPHLPKNSQVYVLFDAWYAGHRLFNFIRKHHWQWICAARGNHRLSHYLLSEWWPHLGHQPIERVTLRSTKGSHTYLTRTRVGWLRRYPCEVKAVFSKRNHRARPVYFLYSTPHLSGACILKYYSRRWEAEVDNWFLKERLGWADYRVQSLDAILNWQALVFVAYAFLQYQRVQPLLDNPKAELQPLGDCLADHQHWHAQQMILHIARLVRSGWSDSRLLEALFPT
jgi:hypothetical protein